MHLLALCATRALRNLKGIVAGRIDVQRLSLSPSQVKRFCVKPPLGMVKKTLELGLCMRGPFHAHEVAQTLRRSSQATRIIKEADFKG